MNYLKNYGDQRTQYTWWTQLTQ